MEADLIQKYSKYSVSELIKIATKHFNAYIRKRDEGDACISCRRFSEKMQAGHFFSAGHHPALRFNEYNVNGQCVRCNMFLSGNLHEYGRNLVFKIGQEKISELNIIADTYKRTGFKWDRFSLIDIIEKYKLKNKHC